MGCAGLPGIDVAEGPHAARMYVRPRNFWRKPLNRETVAALSDAAVAHLFSSTGDLALSTTRKRRPEL